MRPQLTVYVYLAAFLIGLLLAVRLMFFGAERRKRWSGATPLRRSELAVVAFLVMFGISGYLLARRSTLSPPLTLSASALLSLAWAAIVTRLAIATAQIQPSHDPDDPRHALQGRVGALTIAIPEQGEGMLRLQEESTFRTMPARSLHGGAIALHEEVCIERIEGDVAFVELWSLVEQRL